MIVLSEILNIFILSRFFMLRVNTTFILEQFWKKEPFLDLGMWAMYFLSTYKLLFDNETPYLSLPYNCH